MTTYRSLAMCLGIALFWALGAHPAHAQDPASVSDAIVIGDTGRRVDRYLRWAELFGYSGSALVALEGKIVLHKGYGLADREKNIPARPNTFYSFGSIAKQFTGAAVAELHARGQLDVDDPIAKYLDDVPEDKRVITIRNLLTHTSGIPDYHAETDFEPMTREKAVENILAKELDFEPGSEFSYSNSGYTLAAAIAEIVSGRPYVQLMREEFFKPAGMMKTGFMGEAELWAEGEVATIYQGKRDNGSPRTLHGPTWALLGNGGVVSSVGEMYLWDRALYRDDVVSAKAKELIFTPHLNDYGFGWDVVKTPRGTTMHNHDGGSSLGLSANFFRFPDEDAAVILTSNATFLGKLAIEWISTELVRVAFDESNPLPEPPVRFEADERALKELRGAFETPDGGEIRFWSPDGNVAAHVMDPVAVAALIPGSDEDRTRLEQFNDRAKVVADALRDGDESKLAEMTDPGEKADAFRAMAGRIWTRWINDYGPLVDYEILGSAPVWWDVAGGDATWIRLEFEKQTRLNRWHWTGDRFSGVGGSVISAPLTIFLTPTSKDKFTWFHFGSSATGSVEIDRNWRGRLKKITFNGLGGAFSIQKTK